MISFGLVFFPSDEALFEVYRSDELRQLMIDKRVWAVVDEPTKEEALEILRGLKEKYELHHGVRIKDKALSATVELSSRYINHRFLPDKAIDLIDEAASQLNIEINSVPVETDELQREIIRLQVKVKALEFEEGMDVSSIKKLLDEKLSRKSVLVRIWEKERAILNKDKGLKVEYENARLKLQQVEKTWRFRNCCRT